MCLGVEGCLRWERGKIAVGNNESLRLNWRGSCRIRAKNISSQMKRNILSSSCGKDILLVTIQDEMLATQQYSSEESLSALSWGTIPAQVGYHLCPVGLDFIVPMPHCFFFQACTLGKI